MEPPLLSPADASTGVPVRDSAADFIYCHPPFANSWMATGYMQEIRTIPATTSTCQMYNGVPPVRAGPINAPCRYFGSEGGCQDPHCRFLHDEPFQNVVFYDGNETFMRRCQPVATQMDASPPEAPPDASKQADATGLVEAIDVRIFFGNCPAFDVDARIRAVVEPIGQVDRLDIMPSTLHNRRVSGFIHMSSLEAAEAAVDKLNATKLGRRGAKVYAKIKSCDTVLRPAPVEDDLGLSLGSLPPLIEVDEDAASFGDSESPLTVMANGIDGAAPSTFALDKLAADA